MKSGYVDLGKDDNIFSTLLSNMISGYIQQTADQDQKLDDISSSLGSIDQLSTSQKTNLIFKIICTSLSDINPVDAKFCNDKDWTSLLTYNHHLISNSNISTTTGDSAFIQN